MMLGSRVGVIERVVGADAGRGRHNRIESDYRRGN